MCHYCVNSIAQETGEHEVHKEDCKHSPNMVFKKYLGYFSNCSIAIEEAKKIYPKSKGCKYCLILSPICFMNAKFIVFHQFNAHTMCFYKDIVYSLHLHCEYLFIHLYKI